MAVAVRGGGDVTVRQRWCNKIGVILVKRKYLGFIGGLRNGPVNVYWAGHREPDEIRFVRIRVAHYRNIWRFGLELSVNGEKRRRPRTTTEKGFWFWTLKETQSDAFHRSFAQTLTSSSCIHSPRSGVAD
ncbi:hypothetical protein GmHk_11G031796 [Glycine max]|nr:hypothetical protein GmHk_11G031796 [Glycine max]KAH1224712.1 hypothetical protein GmHk_11G031796 [Glycine max]